MPTREQVQRAAITEAIDDLEWLYAQIFDPKLREFIRSSIDVQKGYSAITEAIEDLEWLYAQVFDKRLQDFIRASIDVQKGYLADTAYTGFPTASDYVTITS